MERGWQGHAVKVLGWLILLNVIWSPVNLCVVLGVQGCSPLALAALRWSLLAVLIWSALSVPRVRGWFKVKFPQGKDRWVAYGAGLLLTGPAHALYYIALTQTNTGEAGAINCTGPFWSTIAAVIILRETVSAARWIAILGGVVGAYFITFGFAPPSFNGPNVTGNLLYLLATLLEAIGFVLTTQVLRRSSAIGSYAIQVLGNVTILWLIPAAFPQMAPFAINNVTPTVLASLGYLAIGAGLFAWGGWYIISEKTPVSYMLVTLGIQAPLAAWIGIQWLQEVPTPGLWMGIAVILLSLILAARDTQLHPEVAPVFDPEPS